MPLTRARHAAHKEVVVDIQLFPLQQGGEEFGPAEDLLITGGVLVNLGHDPDPLEIDILGGRS